MSDPRSEDVPAEAAIAIPNNWAMPAQVSAAAAGVTTPPRMREVEKPKGHPFVWLTLLVATALLFWALTVGVLAPDAEIDSNVFESLETVEQVEARIGAAASTDVDTATPARLSEPAAAGQPAPPPGDPSFPALPPASTIASNPAPRTTPTPAPAAGESAAAAGDAAADGEVVQELPVRKKAIALVQRAERRIKLKNFAGASKLIEQALQLDIELPRAHRARAVVCAQRGDATCARESYETYLKLAPEAADAPNVRRILELGE